MEAEACLPIERHNANPVAATKYKHRLVRRLGQPFYVRLVLPLTSRSNNTSTGMSSLSK